MLKSLDDFSNKYFKGTIILISNVYGRTKLISHNKLNITSEFFSEEEYDYILTSLKECKYNVICYFDENDFIFDYLSNNLKQKNILVFNLARNGYGVGKKSLIPTFCDLNNIMYTASNGYACSFARNKYHVNSLLKYLGLNSLESYVYDGFWFNNQYPKKVKHKFIVKPLFESASQGISDKSIFDPKSAKQSLNDFVKEVYTALNHSPLLVQQFIEGFEAKTTIIDLNKPFALPPIGVEINGFHNLGSKIISDEIAFNYNHKNYLLESELGKQITDRITSDAVKVYNAIGMQNYGRIDCRIDAKNMKIYYMDFSTMPYFVNNGEMLFAFKILNKDIHCLLNTIINSALQTKYNFTLGNT